MDFEQAQLQLIEFIVEESMRTVCPCKKQDLNLIKFIVENPLKITIEFLNHIYKMIDALVLDRFAKITFGGDIYSNFHNFKDMEPEDLARSIMRKRKDNMPEVSTINQIIANKYRYNDSVPFLPPEIMEIIRDMVVDDYIYQNKSEIHFTFHLNPIIEPLNFEMGQYIIDMLDIWEPEIDFENDNIWWEEFNDLVGKLYWDSKIRQIDIPFTY